MEIIAYKVGMALITLLTEELILKRYNAQEAEEFKTERISFPQVQHQL